MKLKKLLASILSIAIVLSTVGVFVYADGTALAKIGDTGYETVAAALAAAQEAGMQDVEITLVGETTKESAMALKDMFNLYSTTQFDSITVKQENASTPYYINELQTGSRNNGGNFIFDGVNIVVVDQYIFEGNVRLTNNSVVKSIAEANCFIYSGTTTVEPGSKLQGVIEDLRAGKLIIDGGKNDGEFNTTPDMQDAILVINWSGDSITLNNGAYLKVNSANEIGRMTVNAGTELNINDSKLDAVEYISNAGTINIDANSLITVPKITGAGVINIDASDMDCEEVQIIKANMSGFTGTVNINGNADYEITNTGIVLTAKATAPAVAKIGDASYATIQSAVDAAQNGDTITIVADVADEAVSVNKNVVITGQQTLNNVSFNAVADCTELTVKNLSFTGNSWINSGAADKLTVSGVTADVTPSNRDYTNSRSAFISLGKSEQKLLDLVVENCNIVSRDGTDPVLGWAAIKTAILTGNTFGSENAYQANSDSVKFMSVNADAVFTITNNTVYSNYNGIVLAQNTTRENAYTATFAGNTFYGGADHIWIEVSGSTTTHAKIRVSSDNTVNGNAMTIGDVKYHSNIKSWTGYIGLDVTVNSNDEITGGTFTVDPTEYLAEGYVAEESNGMYVVSQKANDDNDDDENSILQNADETKAEAAGLVAFSGETGGIKWCSYSFLVNMNGQNSISATVSVNGEEKPLQTKNNWEIGANIDGNTAFGVVVTGVDAVDAIIVDVQ